MGGLFALPAMLLLVALILAPLGCLLLSFTDYEIGALSPAWVGLGNFERALADPVFRRAIGNTLLYVAIVLPGNVILGLLIALLVHARLRTRGLYETEG